MSGGIIGVGAPDPGTNALINRLANPPNPFEQLGPTVNALTNLRQFQANQAGANAYRQAVDPTTGQLDIGLYNRLMAAGPGAYNLGAAMQQAGQGVEAQGRGTSANVQAKLDQLAVQQAYMGPALGKAQQGTLTADDLTKSLDAVPAGIIDPATQASIRAQIASGENPNTIVLGGYFASQQGREMLKAQMPQVGGVSSGSVWYPTQANPIAPPLGTGNQQYPTSGMPLTMSPAEASTIVPLTIGNQTVQVPLGQAAPILAANPNLINALPPDLQQIVRGALARNPSLGGAGTAAPPGSASGHYPGAPAPGVPTPTPAPAPTGGPPATGSTAPYLQPPPPPSGTATPPPGQLPAGGGVGVSPSPGEVEAQKGQAGVSSAALANLTTAVNEAPATKALLNDMRAQLQQPGWEPGLGAQTGSTWRQVLQRLHLTANGPQAGELQIGDAQAAQEEFNKDANLVATRQLAALGNPSDARQQLSEMTTPGLGLSAKGNIALTSTLLGNQQALETQNRAWQAAKNNGWSDARYGDWVKDNWNATDPTTGGKFDPRIFWMANTPGGRNGQWNDMVKKIPTDQQAQFAKDVKYAAKEGWITQSPDDGSWSTSQP